MGCLQSSSRGLLLPVVVLYLLSSNSFFYLTQETYGMLLHPAQPLIHGRASKVMLGDDYS